MTPDKLLTLLCTVSLFAFSLAQEHGGTGGTENEAESTKPLSPCARPLEELHHSIEGIFSENYTVYINCLSFDAEGALRLGVASGQSPNGPDLKYLVECRGDVLVAKPGEGSIDTTDIRDTSCVECLTNGTCTETCAPQCERCYGSATTCTRCTACTSKKLEKCIYENMPLTCQSECPGAETINHELYNFCECVSPSYKLLDNYPPADPEAEIDCNEEEEEPESMCIPDCNIRTHPGLDGDDETGICWACGIPYCVMCQREANECNRCVTRTVLFEHECYPCPNASIALAALEQEEELELEHEEQGKRAIKLGVSLPVVSILIIVFFVSMSVFAHYRYPHVSYHGHKRHRKPPTEELERSRSPTVNIEDQPPVSNVWRPRPTIVLR